MDQASVDLGDECDWAPLMDGGAEGGIREFIEKRLADVGIFFCCLFCSFLVEGRQGI